MILHTVTQIFVVVKSLLLAVAILPSMAIYPQKLFCHELFVIGQS